MHCSFCPYSRKSYRKLIQNGRLCKEVSYLLPPLSKRALAFVKELRLSGANPRESSQRKDRILFCCIPFANLAVSPEGGTLNGLAGAFSIDTEISTGAGDETQRS